jgi:hypothetical protein
LLLVDAAIDFHHQPSCVAVEIHNKSVDDLLATKVKAVQPISAKMSPQDLLLLSHPAMKFFSTLHFSFVNPLSGDDVASGHFLDLSPGPSPTRRGEQNISLCFP